MNAAHARRLRRAPDLFALQAAFSDRFPFLLDSAGGPPALSRYSFLLGVDSSVEPILAPPLDSFFSRLDAAYAQEHKEVGAQQLDVPYIGGWFVYLGYELAGAVEPGLHLPSASECMPVAGAWRCPCAFILDHHTSEAWIVAETASELQQLTELIASFEARGKPQEASPAQPAAANLHLDVEDPRRYREAVACIQQYILDGDVFQVNLSRAWRGVSQQPLDPHRLYQQLRQANPAPFACLCKIGEEWVLSSSPERLVEMSGDRVQTRPIAGTRPRSSENETDRALGEELLLHPKERAEHVMLIDLERNDLGRVCRPGSIHVSELMVLESHAHVHHIVSNIRGRLSPATTPGEVIQAVFPGGTITGCPKVRCMEIIAELEAVGRAYYTGSLGYLSRHGHMDLNILIRTLTLRGRRLGFRTGAGIVADSDPGREVEETVAKAHGMLLALGHEGQS